MSLIHCPRKESFRYRRHRKVPKSVSPRSLYLRAKNLHARFFPPKYHPTRIFSTHYDLYIYIGVVRNHRLIFLAHHPPLLSCRIHYPPFLNPSFAHPVFKLTHSEAWDESRAIRPWRISIFYSPGPRCHRNLSSAAAPRHYGASITADMRGWRTAR